MAEALPLGAKAEHVFERSVQGKLISFKVTLRALSLKRCHCSVEENGKEISSSEHALTLPRFSFKNFFQGLQGIPRWAWIFVGVCGLIPVVTLGGAIPAVIGFSGAWGCSEISKRSWHVAIRCIVCLIITIFAWVSLVVVLGAIAATHTPRSA